MRDRGRIFKDFSVILLKYPLAGTAMTGRRVREQAQPEQIKQIISGDVKLVRGRPLNSIEPFQRPVKEKIFLCTHEKKKLHSL